MKKPEWKKVLEDKVASEETRAKNALNTHSTTVNIHRPIHISTVSPTNTDGSNGDIWITYEA